MSAYYNENDRQKAATLRNLIEEGAIAPGVVDERSIKEVQPDDVKGFCQAHFFAGGGIWSYALRLAGWPDDRPVWTGSCPCGPFSKAGLRKGFDDPRHLWPEWLRLICERRPDVLFGEQSDEADAWLDLVSSDLEGRGYAIGSAIVPAAGFGGYHGRHRIGFVADADNAEWWSERAPWHDGFWPKTGRVKGDGHARDGGAGGWMADTHAGGQPQQSECHGPGAAGGLELGSGRSTLRRSDAGQLGDADGSRADRGGLRQASGAPSSGPGALGGDLGQRVRPVHSGAGVALGLVHPAECGWRMGGEGYGHLFVPGRSGAVEWVACRDGRWRPIEPGLSPLVDAHPGRLAQLRIYGDAIDAEAFANFIGAYLDAAPRRVAA